MNKTICIALLFLGAVLLVLGFVAYDSVTSDFSRVFTGEPTDKSIWLLLGGGLSGILGIGGLSRVSK